MIGFCRIRQHTRVSAYPSISSDDIGDLTINIPNSKTQQKRIAKILSTLDEKIETNIRINTELETIAKDLYDYWFIQFDFPDVNSKPYKSSGGQMAYNSDLKREIPKGWEVSTLSNWIATDKTGDWGKDIATANYNLEVRCIRGADINGLNGVGNINAPKRYILKKNHQKLLSPFDFIIEISGGSPTQSTGRIAYITEKTFERFDSPLVCSNFCKAVSLVNNQYFYNFYYLWSSCYNNGIFFGWEGKTSGIKNLLFDSFIKNYYIETPPKNLAVQFFKYIDPIQKMKNQLLQENSELSTLRDWLLPLLINGHILV